MNKKLISYMLDVYECYRCCIYCDQYNYYCCGCDGHYSRFKLNTYIFKESDIGYENPSYKCYLEVGIII